MPAPYDYSLYLVTDRPLCGGRDLEEVVAQAVQGGATVVQLREKDCGTREFVELARRLQQALAGHGVPLFINDRLDVALAAGADGIHLGQSDLDVEDALRLIGDRPVAERMAIGLSVDSPEQVRRAESMNVDYLGVGPIFATSTKSDAAPVWGLEALAAVRRESRHVLVGIGGIHAANCADVIRAGADGVAVVSALCAAPSPADAARHLLQEIECGRAGRS